MEQPVVSDQQLAEAKKVLKDAENKKRIQSNMRFALQQEDVWDRYLVKPMAARKKRFAQRCRKDDITTLIGITQWSA